MNPFILVLPFLLIRYIYLRILSREAMNRADYFPPVKGKEKIAYYISQLSTIFLMIYLVFTKISLSSIYNYLGIFIYITGLIIYTKAIIDFTKPLSNGLNTNGIFHFSRNPMYVANFLNFLGCCLIINSWIYLIVLVIFQTAVHFLILSEERWCLKNYKDKYRKYMKNVRRYI